MPQLQATMTPSLKYILYKYKPVISLGTIPAKDLCNRICTITKDVDILIDRDVLIFLSNASMRYLVFCFVRNTSMERKIDTCRSINLCVKVIGASTSAVFLTDNTFVHLFTRLRKQRRICKFLCSLVELKSLDRFWCSRYRWIRLIFSKVTSYKMSPKIQC